MAGISGLGYPLFKSNIIVLDSKQLKTIKKEQMKEDSIYFFFYLN